MRLLYIILINLTFASYSIIQSNSLVEYFGNHPMHGFSGSSSSITLLSDCNDSGTLCDLIFKVPLISLNSGNDNRDSNMLNYLNAFSYSEVSLSIADFSVREYNEEIVICEMTISGMTEEIQVPLTLLNVSKNEIQYKAESSFIISLNQFNIDIPKLLFIPISSDIKIAINLLIEKKD